MWPYGTGFGGPYSNIWWGLPTGWTDFTMYDYNNNQYLDDNEIADVILDNIEFDPGIPLSDEHKIQVQVNNGVATLSGTVNYPRTKPFAYTDAYWAPGVKNVVNDIEVKPMQQGQAKQAQTSSGNMPKSIRNRQ